VHSADSRAPLNRTNFKTYKCGGDSVLGSEGAVMTNWGQAVSRRPLIALAGIPDSINQESHS